ncbi:MAG TPA: erythromycin esterase family protein [Glycomyces sp.]|nr:erythromycin esterase family protein [Glycomyces sp.]
MAREIHDFIRDSHNLVGLGEPTHREPTFAQIRNELFAQLVDRGFRSVALEIDRVAAFAVDDFVGQGEGTLDEAMSEGFTHGFGAFEGNRQLVAWMRGYNENRPAQERLSFHGIDAPLEFTGESPRRYLEHGRDYLGLDLDIAGLAGEDERWSRWDAVMDPAQSPGDTAEARKLRVIADDLLTALYARAPELIAATSRADWDRARVHLTSALGLLRYHRQAAQRIEDGERWSALSATRDALMAQNLLDIRDLEADRGPTLVFAHNTHLQRNPSRMVVEGTAMGGMDLTWHGTGAIVASLVGKQYAFIAGSLGRSEGLKLEAPEPGTFEGSLQQRFTQWGLAPADSVGSASARTDATQEQAYFPLDQATLDGADAVLHVSEGATVAVPWPSAAAND